MSSVVRLNVPPFEPTAPTSLSALRRPLVQTDDHACDAQCEPCQTCRAAQQAAVEQARALATDLGLRLSQLVEDAMAERLAKIEADQSRLVARILEGVLPHLADAALRRALGDEIARATHSLKDVRLHLVKHPSLNLGVLPDTSRLDLTDDPDMPLHQVRLHDASGTTLIDPDAIIQACLSRLSPALSETQP